jgi:hypothetical protein
MQAIYRFGDIDAMAQRLENSEKCCMVQETFYGTKRKYSTE